MNNSWDQCGVSATVHARVLQVILEVVLKDQPDQSSAQGDQKSLVEDRNKRRGGDMLNPRRNK